MPERKVHAVIQARMLSSRLRGKSLMAVSGVPLLRWVLDRIAAMDFVDGVTVATSDATSDEPIALFAEKHGATVVRGDQDDVLSRFITAAEGLNDDDIIMRFTADNPLYDPNRSKQGWEHLRNLDLDYLAVDGLSHMIPEFVRVGCLRRLEQLETSIRFIANT